MREGCKIWGFHSGDYEACRLLGCGAVWILCEPTFRSNISPPSADCSHLLTLVPCSQIFQLWRWKRYVPPKHRFTQDLHNSTYHKMAFNMREGCCGLLFSIFTLFVFVDYDAFSMKLCSVHIIIQILSNTSVCQFALYIELFVPRWFSAAHLCSSLAVFVTCGICWQCVCTHSSL
jgi:hypothetical protein